MSANRSYSIRDHIRREYRGELIKLWVIGVFAVVSLLVTLYAIQNQQDPIFSQFYYLMPHLYIIPIILVSLWYPRRGLQIIVLLGISVVALTSVFFTFGFPIDPVFSILNAGIDLWIVLALALLARCKEQWALETPGADQITPEVGKSRGDRDAIHEYEQALHTRDERIRGDAARALGESRESRAIPVLADALSDESGSVRGEVARALGKIPDPLSITLLIPMLADDSRTVRESAVQALGALGKDSVDPLIEALVHEDWHVRMGAAIALRIIGDPRSIQPLIERLSDPSRFVRRETVKSLGRMGDPSVLEPLRSALLDEDEGVRGKAEAAIRRILEFSSGVES